MAVAYQEITNGLTNLRLQTYRKQLTAPPHALPTRDAVKAYYLLNDLSQHLFMPMQLVEVLLRNKLNHHITQLKRSQDWYNSIPVTAKSQQQVVAAIDQAIRETGRHVPLAQDVVCRLTFGFWVQLLASPYRSTKNPRIRLWGTTSYRNVFPGASPDLTLGSAFDRLQLLNKLRNRLFHHEPIWRQGKVSSIEEAIIEIQNKYDNIVEVVGWLSPESLALLNAWSFHGRMSKAADSTRFDRNLW